MSLENLDITLEQLEFYWKKFEQKLISPQDISGLFLISFYKIFSNSNFYQIQKKTKHFATHHLDSYEFKNDAFFNSILQTQKYPEITQLYDLFNSLTLKNVKTIALKSLCLWYQKKFDLVVVDFIPEPIAVLRMQTQGTRCISLLRKKEEVLKTYDHNRNVQQFLIHDLEHAWQMFSNPELTKKQINLSKKLLTLHESGAMDFLKENNTTKKTLDYVFSDMNTHPEHTLLSIRSLILDFFKISRGINKLDPCTEREFLQKWDFIQSALI
jgi:hypothetical protein